MKRLSPGEGDPSGGAWAAPAAEFESMAGPRHRIVAVDELAADTATKPVRGRGRICSAGFRIFGLTVLSWRMN